MYRNCVLLIFITLFFLAGCADKQTKIIEGWKVGTSSGLFSDFSLDEFNHFRKSGIAWIEIGSGVFRDKSDEECKNWIADIKQKTEAAGVGVWSVHLPFSRVYDISSQNETDRENMIKECIRIMNLCLPLNPQKYVLHGSAEPIADSVRQARIENCIASLRILVDEAGKVNAQIALECLPRTCLGNTSEELLMIVNSIGDELGICFDSNHLLKEKPEEFVARAGSRIVTLHISDYDGIDERHWLPGMGVINWTAVVDQLHHLAIRALSCLKHQKESLVPTGRLILLNLHRKS
jgi:sugar phosphate isomerase/epimerase